jgi:hypothetical protein
MTLRYGACPVMKLSSESSYNLIRFSILLLKLP